MAAPLTSLDSHPTRVRKIIEIGGAFLDSESKLSIVLSLDLEGAPSCLGKELSFKRLWSV